MKTREYCLLIFIFLFSVSPAYSEWKKQCISCSQFFYHLSQQSTAIDSLGNIHVVYGGGYLYHGIHDGSSWVTEIVDASPSVGLFTSITIDSSDTIHISYIDNLNKKVKYANNAKGAWALKSLDFAVGFPEGMRSGFTSIRIDPDGNPHILYMGAKNGLMHAYNATGRWKTEVIDKDYFYFGGALLLIDNSGQLHIGYLSMRSLKYAFKKDGRWHIFTIDNDIRSPQNREHSSISVAIDNKSGIHITYFSQNKILKYATNTSGPWLKSIVERELGANDQKNYSSIAVDSAGSAHIVYFNSTNHVLKYAENPKGRWHISHIPYQRKKDNNESNPIRTVVPSLIVNSNNKLYLVSSIGNRVIPDEIIHFKKNNDTWKTQKMSRGGAPKNRASYDTAMAIDSSGRIHVLSFGADLIYSSNLTGKWASEIVEEGKGASFLSIACDLKGIPHITYYLKGRLKYATKASGNWVKSIIENKWETGYYSSIAVDSQNSVHISYYDQPNQKLKYATNALGPWILKTINPKGKGGMHSSISLDLSDNVHISYIDGSGLMYASNSTGAWKTENINSAGTMMPESITDSKGNLHVSYFDTKNGTITYANNAQGAWVIKDLVTFSTFKNNAASSSIAIDSLNNIHISYFDFEKRALAYLTNSSGSWQSEIVDKSGISGRINSITVDSFNTVYIN